MPTLAKASLISTRSRSEAARPSRASALAIAPRRLGLQGGVRAADHAVGADLGQPGQAQLLGLGPAHHHHRAPAIGDLRGRAGGDGAVPVEGRAQPAQALGGGVGAHALIGREGDRLALALRDLHRDDLGVEQAVLGRAPRPSGGRRPRRRPALRG